MRCKWGRGGAGNGAASIVRRIVGDRRHWFRGGRWRRCGGRGGGRRLRRWPRRFLVELRPRRLDGLRLNAERRRQRVSSPVEGRGNAPRPPPPPAPLNSPPPPPPPP